MAFSHHGKITTGIDVWKEVTFERVWEIQNFDMVVRDDELLKDQKFFLETSQIPGTSCTWLIGLRKAHWDNKECIDVYCQLSKISNGILPPIQIRFYLAMGKSNTEGEIPLTGGGNEIALSLGQTVCIGCFKVQHCISNCLQSNRSLILNVRLILERRNREQVYRENFQLEEMADPNIRFQTALIDNLGKLLFDEVTSDVKIITGDDVELLGHKLILQMQNPVLASMLQSDFREGNTGTIKVTDINAKTMRIILRYIYTGELLPEWSDAETIVEFMYAAGKYQLTEILKMLDETLGSKSCARYRTRYTPLLSLVGKLSLRKAEKNLLKEIGELTVKLESAEEFFALVDES